MDKKRKKYIILVIVTIAISIIALVGASYALLTMTIEGDKKITLTAGILKVDFDEGDNINLNEIAPMTDSQGLKTTPYTFTVTNTGNINAYYHVSLEEDSNNTLDNSYLKMRLTSDNGYDSGVVKVSSYGTGEFDITSEATLEPSDKVTYQLWMWLDNDADNNAQGKLYQSKIVVTSFDREQGKNAALFLKSKSNVENLDYNSATDTQKKEMWAFNHDATEQTESLTDYRYIGKDPNNYVTFNNETWRIIGVFTVDNGTGNKEEKLKLIRDESIGNYTWDDNSLNDWPNSTLQSYLNSEYYSSSLSEEYSSMIDNSLWYLGGTASNNFYTSDNGLTNNFYMYERSTTIFTGRTTNWIGKVGLMYPSDYGYATSGSSTTSRNTCLNKELYNWINVNDCYTNDWLFNSNIQWTLTSSSNVPYFTFSILETGGVNTELSNITNSVRPVVYLKSDIIIIDGDGSSSNPYILQ